MVRPISRPILSGINQLNGNPRCWGVDAKANQTAARGGPAPGISFDRFVRACVVVKQLSESFGKLDTDRDGWIQINYDQFMHTVLSLP